MGWIPPELDWLINQWAVTMTAACLIYNYLFNKHKPRLIAACFSVAFIYCVGSFGLNWIESLDYYEQLNYRYSTRLLLYFIGIVTLSYFTRKAGGGFVTWLTYSVFFIAILLQLAMHIDRNHISLYAIDDYLFSGSVVVDEYWLLWDWYTNYLLASDVMLVSYFLIGEKTKEFICSLSR
jgi:hypothetical protein